MLFEGPGWGFTVSFLFVHDCKNANLEVNGQVFGKPHFTMLLSHVSLGLCMCVFENLGVSVDNTAPKCSAILAYFCHVELCSCHCSLKMLEIYSIKSPQEFFKSVGRTLFKAHT